MKIQLDWGCSTHLGACISDLSSIEKGPVMGYLPGNPVIRPTEMQEHQQILADLTERIAPSLRELASQQLPLKKHMERTPQEVTTLRIE